MQKITPFLWFNDNAEEAVNFYVSVFKDAKLGSVSRQGEEGPVIVAPFELFGQEFLALNGGPLYSFTPAVSFLVNCETQEEVDEYWAKLSEGGVTNQCGWLTDRFGLSWQIVPSALGRLMSSGTPEQSGRVMQAMLRMTKMDIAKLQQAFDGE